MWRAFRAMLRHAYRRNEIPAIPTDVVDAPTAHGTPNRRRALSGPQVAVLATKVGELHPVYGLIVLFMAYSGLRQAEAQGLELRDVTLSTAPDGTVKGSVRVQRTKTRVRREWVTGTPKSKHSRRTVPVPPWLAAKMADYLRDAHAASHDPQAPLWPRRLPGGARHKGGQVTGAAVRFDWSEPCDLQVLHAKVIRPALAAVGLRATRLHDLRHTFAALQLTAGVHFMQVSKWLGHSSYLITMSVYADYIPDEETANGLPEPVAAAARNAENPNVVPLHRTS